MLRLPSHDTTMKPIRNRQVGSLNLRNFSLCGLIVALTYVTGCERKQVTENSPASQPPDQSPPPVLDGSLLRPTFDTILGTFSAGTAFHISLPNQTRPILLTAIHLLGPDGGCPRKVLPAELPQVVKDVRLRDCFNESMEIGKPVAAIVIPDAVAPDDPQHAGAT